MMTSLMTKTVPKFTTSLLSTSIQRERKAQYIIKRSNSTYSILSSPSHLPTPDELGWESFVANVKRHNYQHPISPAVFLRGQEIYEIKQAFARIEKMFLKIMKSNEQLFQEIHNIDQSRN